jgi:hypothetical protein
MDYVEHDALAEPFPLYESANAWWTDVAKVVKLFNGFVRFRTATRAMVFAGITRDQYYYFIEVHPHFTNAIERFREYRLSIHLDKVNSAKDWHASAFILERELPQEYGRQQGGGLIPAGGSVASLLQEAFMDKDGNVIAKRKTAQLLEHGDDPTDLGV